MAITSESDSQIIVRLLLRDDLTPALRSKLTELQNMINTKGSEATRLATGELPKYKAAWSKIAQGYTALEKEKSAASAQGIAERLKYFAQGQTQELALARKHQASRLSQATKEMNDRIAATKKEAAQVVANEKWRWNDFVQQTEKARAANQRITRSAEQAAKAKAKLAEQAKHTSEHIKVLGTDVYRLDRILIAFAAIGAATTIAKQIAGIIKIGLDFKAEMEQQELGISAVVASYYTLKDASGKVLSGVEAFDAAGVIAANTLERLKNASLNTEATVEDLGKAFQEGTAVMSQYGVSIEDAEKLTLRFALMAQALRIKPNELGQEIRGIFTGDTDPRKSRMAFALYQPEKQAGVKVKSYVADLAREDKLTKLLYERTEQFALMGQRAGKTWTVAMSNLREAFQRIVAEGETSLFSELKSTIIGLVDALVKVDQTGKATFNPIIVAEIKDYADGVSLAVKWAKELYTQLNLIANVKAYSAATGVTITAGEVMREKWMESLDAIGEGKFGKLDYLNPLYAYNKVMLSAGAAATSRLAGFIGGPEYNWQLVEAQRKASENRSIDETTRKDSALKRYYNISTNAKLPVDMTRYFPANFSTSGVGPEPEAAKHIDAVRESIKSLTSVSLEGGNVFKENFAAAVGQVSFEDTGNELIRLDGIVAKFIGPDQKLSVEEFTQAWNEFNKVIDNTPTATPKPPIPEIDEEEVKRIKRLFEDVQKAYKEFSNTTKEDQKKELLLIDLDAAQKNITELETEYKRAAAGIRHDFVNEKETIQKEYEELLKKNAELPEHLRLSEMGLQYILEQKVKTLEEEKKLREQILELTTNLKQIETLREKGKNWLDAGIQAQTYNMDQQAMLTASRMYDSFRRSIDDAEQTFTQVMPAAFAGAIKGAITGSSDDITAAFTSAFNAMLDQGIDHFLNATFGTFFDKMGGNLDQFITSFEKVMLDSEGNIASKYYSWTDSQGQPHEGPDATKEYRDYKYDLMKKNAGYGALAAGMYGLGNYNSIAASGQDQSILGGAIGGGMTGFSMMGGPANMSYSWIGAVVGAVVGAFSTYLGNQAVYDDYKYAIPRITSGGVATFSQVDEDIKPNELKKLIAELQEKFNSVWNGYVALMVKLPNAIIPAITAIDGKFQSKASKYWLKHFDEWLNNKLPEEIAGQFKAGLTKGFVELGMAEDAFTDFYRFLGTLSGEGKLSALNDMADALNSFMRQAEFLAAYGIGPNVPKGRRRPVAIDRNGPSGVSILQDEVFAERHRTFAQTIALSDKELIRFGSSIASLVGPERVKAAKDFAQMMEERMQQEKAYLKELQLLAEAISDAIKGQIRQYRVDLMVDDENKPKYQEQVSYLERYAEQLLTQLTMATSPEEINRIMTEYQNVISQIVGISDQMGPEQGQEARRWAIEVLEIAATMSREAIDRLVEELESQNQIFADAVADFVEAVYDLFPDDPAQGDNPRGDGGRGRPTRPDQPRNQMDALAESAGNTAVVLESTNELIAQTNTAFAELVAQSIYLADTFRYLSENSVRNGEVISQSTNGIATAYSQFADIVRNIDFSAGDGGGTDSQEEVSVWNQTASNSFLTQVIARKNLS